MRIAIATRWEHGHSTVFFATFVVILVVLTAVALEVGRLVYARGEVAKCADAAALAAAAQVDVAGYRDTGRVTCLPNVYAVAQSFAGMNSSYLASRSIPVTVTNIQIDSTSQVVAVTVAADFSPCRPLCCRAARVCLSLVIPRQ